MRGRAFVDREVLLEPLAFAGDRRSELAVGAYQRLALLLAHQRVHVQERHDEGRQLDADGEGQQAEVPGPPAGIALLPVRDQQNQRLGKQESCGEGEQDAWER